MRPATLLRRLLIFVHRWCGVALSLVFLLWFVSGIVMMYWGFPSVSQRDRLQRAPTLNPSQIKWSPEEVFAELGGGELPAQVRLTSFDGRPVYRGGGRRDGATAYADDGSPQLEVDAAMIDRAAAAWTGLPVREATKESIEEIDQWTGGGLRNVRPLFKYSWPDGQQVYVNGNTAEVGQYTTTASRFWAYLGAIPHWFRFTPLQKSPRGWFYVVVWSSLIGTGSVLIGAVIATWMYSPRKRYRNANAPTSIPYRGWKRWHALLGLVFGVVAITWTFSGLLSVGPFRITNRLVDLTAPPDDGSGSTLGGAIQVALRGSDTPTLSAYADRHPDVAIGLVPDFDVKELEYASFQSAPVYLASNGRGETRIIPVSGPPMAAFDADEVMRIVREAAGDSLAELRVMTEYDAYYLDRRGERPLPVVYVRLNDAVGTRYYIDVKTARIVGGYDTRNWINRWLYHGLHSLDFPWLYKYRPLWDIVVISLMLGGTALCLTSIVMTWRVLVRQVARVARGRFNPSHDDLTLESGGNDLFR